MRRRKNNFNIFLTALVIGILVLVCIISKNNTIYAYKTVNYETYVVSQGETLWDIAQEVYPQMEIRQAVDKIIQDNKLDRKQFIQVGQELLIAKDKTQ